MKLKSLILGSIATVGLSTGAFAADLGVLTSLDVCDALGISGLTLSSDTNCLQISGEVSYEFRWGDYRTGPGTGNRQAIGASPLINGNGGTQDGGLLGNGAYPFRAAGAFDPIGSSSDFFDARGIDTDSNNDWESSIATWLTVVGTQDSDFGPAKATITIGQVEKSRYTNENDQTAVVVDGVATTVGGLSFPDGTNGVIVDEAYVSIGDSTVIMAGKKGSIANFADSDPFNYTDLFGYSFDGDTGILFQNDEDEGFTGGQVIQVVSDLGNGVHVAVGLENLAGEDEVSNDRKNKQSDTGTLVGVVSFAGDNITAHATGLAIGLLDGEVSQWGLHVGATGTFDAFRVRGALGYYGEEFGGVEASALHGLLSADATFDLFTVALSGEYIRNDNDVLGTDDAFGIGGSVGMEVTDGVRINLGARYLSSDFEIEAGRAIDNDLLQVSAQLVAAVAETVTVSAEIGGWFNEDYETVMEADDGAIYFGNVGLAWAPGGGFESSVIAEATSEGAYRTTFRASKSFE